VRVTVVPASNQLSGRSTVPLETTSTSRKYCACQFHERVELVDSVKEEELPVPEAGALPVPVQPVAM